MADPITWVTIISTVVSAVGAIQQSNAASASAKSQAQANDYNAQVARNQAQQSLQVSAAEQLMLSRRQRQQAGQSRAAVAQSGTGFGGSNADILEQSDTLAELDLLNLAYEGQMRSQGFQAEAGLQTFQAGAARSNAKNARTAGYLGAARAIGGGFTSLYGSAAAPSKSILNDSGGLGLRPGGGIGLRYGGVRYG
jgi:hypothetical protein